MSQIAHNADFCRLRISKNPANAHETKDFSTLMLEETMVMQVVREIRLIMIVQDYVIKKKIVSNYDDHVWNGIRQITVYEGLLAKFSQNDVLRKKLKDTGNIILAECAVRDRIWGIGLSMRDPKRLNPKQWNGQNMLGYTLMMVRDKI